MFYFILSSFDNNDNRMIFYLPTTPPVNDSPLVKNSTATKSSLLLSMLCNAVSKFFLIFSHIFSLDMSLTVTHTLEGCAKDSPPICNRVHGRDPSNSHYLGCPPSFPSRIFLDLLKGSPQTLHTIFQKHFKFKMVGVPP